MRFVSYCCLLIIGNTVSQVYAQDVEPLPTPASSSPLVVKTVQENVSPSPAITPVESTSIEGFDSAFENALNQFAPKDRTAKLIVGRNQAEDIFGTDNPPEIVSTPDQPEFLDPREFPNSIPNEDNPGGVRPPTGQGDFGGTSESDFTEPSTEATPEPAAAKKEYIAPPAAMIPMGIDFTQQSGSGGGSASTDASQLAPTNPSAVDNGVQPIEITQEPVLVSDQPGQLTQLPLPISEPINIAPVPADMTSLPDQTPHSPFIERSPQLPLANSPQPSSDWYVPEGNGSAHEPGLETGIESLNYSTNSFATEGTSQQLSAPGWSDIVVDPMTWWKSEVIQSLDGSRPIDAVDSNTLVYMALRNSPRIQAVSQNPLIRELQIVEADSEFDAVRYLRSQFEDRVDPVGNQLTVGNGESFLKDNIWSADAGFRKKARNGANWELNQQLGFQNSNSNFFVPQDQGTATLALNVTQPLLRGRGRYYNESQILIAQATNGAAWRTFQAELQDELLGVMSAYWDLYLTRSIFLQKQRNVERGAKILDRLEGRKELDSLPSQIARARSSVQTRRTELANALRDVLNAETEVRRRIADTSWINSGGTELIPGELPYAATFNVPLEQVVYNALQHRPEVHEALNRVRVASVQRDVSANELLPELSLLMGTYVSALRGDTGILNAFQDQFGQVKPGYSFGINFELPYGNRAARSRLAQRQLQVRKIRAEVEEVMQSVIAESQVALRRVQSASETLVAATEAIRAARSDREQFERRWESFALVEGDLADGQNPTTVLDQLLDSQDRLASAELVYVQAERELKVAEVSLQRAMGTLLMAQNVTASRGFEQDIPRMDIIKSDTSMPGMVSEIPVEVPQVQQYQEVSPTGYIQTPW